MSSTAEILAVEVGEVVLGKYRVEGVIGKGGMGYVVSATHLDLDEKVAIKIMRSDSVGSEEAAKRFIREAQAAAKLKSEYVTRVIDVGVLPDGSPYMAMEFLEGSDLSDMVERNGALGLELAVDLLLQACEGLAEAHGRGIVHRDIKPSNVFVTWRADGSPLVKILDFGISRATTPGAELSLTQTASVLGTPAYMSPEQMRSSRRVDSRTDIWSLGVVLFEILEARWPFLAESFTEMCAKVAADDPERMSDRVPPALQAVVYRCLEKNVDRRYADVGELAVALAPFARDQRESTLRVERIKRIVVRGKLGQSTPTARPAENRGDGSLGGWEGSSALTPPPAELTPPPGVEVARISERTEITAPPVGFPGARTTPQQRPAAGMAIPTLSQTVAPLPPPPTPPSTPVGAALPLRPPPPTVNAPGAPPARSVHAMSITASTGSGVAYVDPRIERSGATESAPPVRTGSRRWLVIATALVVAIVGIVIASTRGGGAGTSTVQAPIAQPLDAAVVEAPIAKPVTPDAAPAVPAASLDAALAVEPPVPVDAAIVADPIEPANGSGVTVTPKRPDTKRPKRPEKPNDLKKQPSSGSASGAAFEKRQ